MSTSDASAPKREPVDVQKLRELQAQITPLPWQFFEDEGCLETVKTYGGTLEDPVPETKLIDPKYELANRAYILAACNELPACLDLIEDLRKDKARLDWLEQRGWASTRAMFGEDGGFMVDNEGQVMPGTTDAGYEHRYLREAIDAAMRGEPKEGM